jgi:hypothetical protein
MISLSHDGNVLFYILLKYKKVAQQKLHIFKLY